MDLFELSCKMDDLLEKARNEFTFDEDFNQDIFCELMKCIYEYFIKNRDSENPLNPTEIGLYSKLYAYSMIPCVTQGENGDMFELSTKIAGDISHMILYPGSIEVENDVMMTYFMVDDEEVLIRYDFNSGDFSDYESFRDNYGWW